MPAGPESGSPRRPEWEAAAAGSDRERANLDQLSFGCAPAGAYADAASDSGAVQMLGDVWEWTSSDFTAYPGFAAFPYPEYSEVFFGDSHKVLRGGAWATRRDVIRTSFRNWDLPIRRQIFAGIRCAKDERMNNIAAAVTDRIAIQVNLPPGGPLSGMAADVRAGLTSPFKELSPRYFYDEKGSELFEQITELEEYYPTRCERAILEGRSAEICEAANRPASLIELGLRLGPQDPRSARRDEGRRLPGDLLPGRHLGGDHPRHRRADRRRVRRHQRAWVGLRLRVRSGARPGRRAAGDRTARRHDRQLRARISAPDSCAASPTCSTQRTASCSARTSSRTRATLEAAYNDSAGVTAEFNKNVLAVLNRELGADFDIDSFEHVARWDPENLWVDIRLRSQANQVVNVGALDMLVPFAAGEEMRTEISTKFLRPGLEGIYAEAGLELTDWWTDPEGLYALSLARAA